MIYDVSVQKEQMKLKGVKSSLVAGGSTKAN